MRHSHLTSSCFICDNCRLSFSSFQKSPILATLPILPAWLLASQRFSKPIQVTNLYTVQDHCPTATHSSRCSANVNVFPVNLQFPALGDWCSLRIYLCLVDRENHHHCLALYIGALLEGTVCSEHNLSGSRGVGSKWGDKSNRSHWGQRLWTSSRTFSWRCRWQRCGHSCRWHPDRHCFYLQRIKKGSWVEPMTLLATICRQKKLVALP